MNDMPIAPRCAERTDACRWGLPAVARVARALRIAKPCGCIKPHTHGGPLGTETAAHICAHGQKWWADEGA